MTPAGAGATATRPATAVLVAVTLVLLISAVQWPTTLPRLVSADISNPDSYYKLVMLRERTAEHGYAFVARDNAPYGSWMHWSMPHSETVWQLHRALRAAGVPDDAALRYAGGLATQLSVLLVALFVAIAVIRVGTPRTAMLSGLVLAASAPIHGYGRIDQITHHIFMLVPLAAAAACLLQRVDVRRPALDGLGGVLLGLALWVSPETMPFVVGLAGIAGARRMQHPQSAPLWPTAAGMVAMVVLAWAIDPPPPTFSAWALDHISLAYLVLASLLAALMLTADACARRRVPLQRALPLLAALAVACAAGWLLAVPGARAGPSGLLPDELQRLFWAHILELKPAGSLVKGISYLLLPLCGAALAAHAAWRRRSLWLAALAAMALVYGLLGVWHIRMATAAAVAAALAFAAGAAVLRGMNEANDRLLSRRDIGIALGIALLPHTQLFAFAAAYGLIDAGAPSNDPSACRLQPVAAALDRLPPAIILTALTNGPELLYRTHHRTVAGPYHHNVDGMLDSFRAWTDIDGTVAREIVRRRGVGYVLGCEKFQAALRGGDGDRSLAQRVTDGDVPRWLEAVPWPAGIDTDWHLYRVRSDVADQDREDRSGGGT